MGEERRHFLSKEDLELSGEEELAAALRTGLSFFFFFKENVPRSS